MEKETKGFELVVIDTSVFIDYLRNYPSAIIYFQSIPQEMRKSLFFSAITETELISGKSCNENLVRTGVIGLLNSFTKIEVHNQIALKAGDLCRIYNISLPDAIIASTALIKGVKLFTRNIKDFENVPGLKLKISY
jgi:predicted nucleic acid-binding protein